MSVIHVEDLTASYGYQPVLWDIDVDIEEGSLTAIVGPNGAGKSTLLKSILGFLKPLSGAITLYGLPLKDVLNRLAYVPQRASVNWDFPITVFDVVLMGRYSSLGWFHRPGNEDKKLALDALEEMKISDLKDRQISELSGGQKQRVFIARALCQNAQLILMDEPLAGVDKTSEKIIMDKMKALQKEGKTIVCVHHDLQTLRDYFDHVVLINRKVIAYGSIKDVLTQENLDTTFQEGTV